MIKYREILQPPANNMSRHLNPPNTVNPDSNVHGYIADACVQQYARL